MMNFKKGLAALAVGIAVTALASPSYAQRGPERISAAKPDQDKVSAHS